MVDYFLRKYKGVQEVRIRCNKNIIVLADSVEYEDKFADKFYIDRMLAFLTSNSVYAFKEEITEGFISVFGGNRAGICGRGIVRDGHIEHIKEVSSINLRFAREFKGCSDAVFEKIRHNICNVVFVSPPGCGKTTMLRDLARNLSYSGLNVCIVDERCEIAPLKERAPVFDLGPRCDIMSAVPKSKGMNMVLRTMNPDVIVVDEIGNEDDAQAVLNAVNSGVNVVASFHGATPEEFRRRFVGRDYFKCVVILGKDKRIGDIIC